MKEWMGVFHNPPFGSFNIFFLHPFPMAFRILIPDSGIGTTRQGKKDRWRAISYVL
jgi:hypothetical protein